MYWCFLPEAVRACRPLAPIFRAYDLAEALKQKGKAVVNLQFVVDKAERVTVNKERTVLQIRDPIRGSPVKVMQLQEPKLPKQQAKPCLSYAWTSARTLPRLAKCSPKAPARQAIYDLVLCSSTCGLAAIIKWTKQQQASQQGNGPAEAWSIPCSKSCCVVELPLVFHSQIPTS